MKKTVAIVGGSSGLGLHIVEAIHNGNRSWRVIVFSRSSKSLPGLPSVPVIPVSYDPQDSAVLVDALRSNNVHTVICSIGALGEGLAKSQLAVLDAAMRSGTVKRFVPSEWAGVRKHNDPEAIPAYRYRDQVLQAVKKSGLEYTVFIVGLFMNYFAQGTQGMGHLSPISFPLIDIPRRKADLPGNGNDAISITRLEDVADCVKAMLDVEDGRWPQECRIVGSTRTLNEALRVAERIKGSSFDVRYTSEAEMKLEMRFLSESDPRLFDLQTRIGFMHGEFVFQPNFHNWVHTNPMDLETFMKKWWTK